jgi:ankyrin repeat protein
LLDPEQQETSEQIGNNWKLMKSQEFQGVMEGIIRNYENLYSRVLPPELPGQTEKRSIAEKEGERILLWVLGATRPLTQEEYFTIQDGTVPDASKSEKPQVMKLCRNFVHASEDGTIVPSHSSVRTYLSLRLTTQVDNFLACSSKRDEEGETAEEKKTIEEAQRSILEQAQKDLAQIAQLRLGKECLTRILSAGTESIARESEDILLAYACKNWFKRVSATTEDDKIPGDLLGLMERLFDSSKPDAFLKWLSIYDPDQPTGLSTSVRKPPDFLYYATLMGFPNLVQLLLEKGANVNLAEGGHFGRPLQLACYKGQMSLIRLLLAHKANIDEADDVLGTPLQAAIAGSQHNVAVTLMDEFKADVKARGKVFGNALQIALAVGDRALVGSIAPGAQDDMTARIGIWIEVWEKFSYTEGEYAAKIILKHAILQWGQAGREVFQDFSWRVMLLIHCMHCRLHDIGPK